MKTAKRRLSLALCLCLCAAVLPAMAASRDTTAVWVVNTWSETFPLNVWGETDIPTQLSEMQQTPQGEKKTVWVSGWLLPPTDAFYDNQYRLIWEGQVPGLEVSGDFAKDWGGPVGYPEECFNEDGEMYIRCGFPISMEADADAAQLIYRFFTECRPRLQVTNEETGCNCEYTPRIGIRLPKNDGVEDTEAEWWYFRTDELETEHISVMESRLPAEGIKVHVKEIAELTEADLPERPSDWPRLALFAGDRCWKVVFQLDVPENCSIRLATPFSRKFDEELFVVGGEEKPFYFLGDSAFSRVGDDGCFTGCLTTRVEGLNIGSLYEMLCGMELEFLLSTEPLMVVGTEYVNVWSSVGELVD